MIDISTVIYFSVWNFFIACTLICFLTCFLSHLQLFGTFCFNFYFFNNLTNPPLSVFIFLVPAFSPPTCFLNLYHTSSQKVFQFLSLLLRKQFYFYLLFFPIQILFTFSAGTEFHLVQFLFYLLLYSRAFPSVRTVSLF